MYLTCASMDGEEIDVETECTASLPATLGDAYREILSLRRTVAQQVYQATLREKIIDKQWSIMDYRWNQFQSLEEDVAMLEGEKGLLQKKVNVLLAKKKGSTGARQTSEIEATEATTSVQPSMFNIGTTATKNHPTASSFPSLHINPTCSVFSTSHSMTAPLPTAEHQPSTYHGRAFAARYGNILNKSSMPQNIKCNSQEAKKHSSRDFGRGASNAFVGGLKRESEKKRAREYEAGDKDESVEDNDAGKGKRVRKF